MLWCKVLEVDMNIEKKVIQMKKTLITGDKMTAIQIRKKKKKQKELLQVQVSLTFG